MGLGWTLRIRTALFRSFRSGRSVPRADVRLRPTPLPAQQLPSWPSSSEDAKALSKSLEWPSRPEKRAAACHRQGAPQS
jgi:hypothetical protein